MLGRLDNFKTNILLVGAGQMGGAMLKGWHSKGLNMDLVSIQDPNPPANMRQYIEENKLKINEGFDPTKRKIVIFAVKPQMAEKVISSLKNIHPHDLVISIMAGTTINKIENSLSIGQPIIRTIPNTPSSVGRGITAAFANENASDDQIFQANLLLTSLGPVEWVEREELIDVATAVSGSGPAYVFLMVESLAKAGIAAGLPPEIAMNLARATVEGAGELLYQSQSTGASTLRENVTSPNGTTHAALQVLMGDNGLDKLMTEAVKAAAARSKELAS